MSAHTGWIFMFQKFGVTDLPIFVFTLCDYLEIGSKKSADSKKWQWDHGITLVSTLYNETLMSPGLAQDKPSFNIHRYSTFRFYKNDSIASKSLHIFVIKFFTNRIKSVQNRKIDFLNLLTSF